LILCLYTKIIVQLWVYHVCLHWSVLLLCALSWLVFESANHLSGWVTLSARPTCGVGTCDQAMASQNMDKLPQEMRDEICKKVCLLCIYNDQVANRSFQLFDDYSRHDLTALARVSRTWNYTATPFIYRELILNFRDIDSIWAARFLHRIMDPNAQTSNYRLYIRSLRIWMTSPHRSQPRLPLPQNVLTVLGNFVATLPRLEVFE